MKRADEIDKNFKVETNIQREGLTFHEITEEPFTIYGIFREGEKWVRLPDAVAASVSDGVHSLSKHTAGGRVRFITDSPYVAIKTKQPTYYGMDHMARTGASAFDLYVGKCESSKYVNTFRPPVTPAPGYESVIDLGAPQKRLITINFPLYCEVHEILIGLKEGCVIEKAEPYAFSTPFVYYGSSITQGGCASRAGTSYQGFISRKFDADYINLGFSGNARAEDPMIEYVAGLDMSMFVYDYDHNAPNAEHLEKTHEKMFLAVREKHPNIPIIILSRPNFKISDEDARYKVIKKTYDNAIARGDDNVYYIPGRELMRLCGDEGTVDNCHPTDLGFYSMAQVLGEEIEKIITEGKLKP